MAEQNIKEIDSGFFTRDGVLDYRKYFSKYVNTNGKAALKFNENYDLASEIVHVSNNTFPTEYIECREFRPNQFAILGLFDTIKEFIGLGSELALGFMSSSTDKEKSQAATNSDSDKENKLIQAKNRIVRTGKLSLLAMLNTLQPSETNGESLFIEGPQRNMVPAKYRRLDMFYDLPQFFYRNLSAGVYGRTFTLPIINNSSYINSSSVSQYEVDDGNLGAIRDLLSKVTGQMTQIGLPSGITWKGDSGSFPAINYTIDLHNKNIISTKSNIDFINNIIAGNMWAQRGLFKSPSSLYDVTIGSRHTRMFYCTGSFNCAYEGKIRSKTINASTIAIIAPGNIDDMLKLNNDAVGKREDIQKEKDDMIAELNNQLTQIEESVKAKQFNRKLLKDYKKQYKNLQVKLQNLEKVTLDQNSANIMIMGDIAQYLNHAIYLLEDIQSTVAAYTDEMKKYRKINIEITPPEYEVEEKSGLKTYMSQDGKLNTVYDYGEKKTIEEKQKTEITAEKNPILEKIDKFIKTLTTYIAKLREQRKYIFDNIPDDAYNLAVDNAKSNEEEAQRTKGLIVEGFDQSKYNEKHIDAASTAIENYNAVSNEDILACIDEFNSIAKDYESVKKSDKYSTKSDEELNQMATTYDNKINTATSTKDRLAANKEFRDSNRTPYKDSINKINETKEKTESYYNGLIAEYNKKIATLNTELESSMTSLTPTLTHIPDIFKLTVEFNSLLPNNLNAYLYSIEYSMKTNSSEDIKQHTDDYIRLPKLASFVESFKYNFNKLKEEFGSKSQDTIVNTDGSTTAANTIDTANSTAIDEAITNRLENAKKTFFNVDTSIFDYTVTELAVANSVNKFMKNSKLAKHHPAALIDTQQKVTNQDASSLSNAPLSASRVAEMNSKTEI